MSGFRRFSDLKIFGLSLCVVGALFMAGCTQTGALFKPDSRPSDDKAMIYVYMWDTNAVSIITGVLEIDGQVIGRVKNKGYVAVPVMPGRHVIRETWDVGWIGNKRLENKPIALRVDARPGLPTYVQLSAESNFDMTTTHMGWRLAQVDEPYAISQLQLCHQSIEPQPTHRR
jgi:hypothetical protein